LATDPRPSDLGDALSEVVQKSQLLIREEIELAKTEMTEKVTKLVKGAVIATIAGVFAVFGLIYLLHALAWGIWRYVPFIGDNDFWAGFLIVAVLIFLLGGLAGYMALRFIKGGAPPTPELALEEGRLIKATLTGGERGAAIERQRQEVRR
jgi:uncharacterized membrane protein YqjE